MKNKRKYSVLLLYPDYIAGEFGKETYFAWVLSATPALAVELAQHEAWQGNGEHGDQKDFYTLLVVEGHIKDIAPEP